MQNPKLPREVPLQETLRLVLKWLPALIVLPTMAALIGYFYSINIPIVQKGVMYVSADDFKDTNFSTISAACNVGIIKQLDNIRITAESIDTVEVEKRMNCSKEKFEAVIKNINDLGVIQFKFGAGKELDAKRNNWFRALDTAILSSPNSAPYLSEIKTHINDMKLAEVEQLRTVSEKLRYSVTNADPAKRYPALAYMGTIMGLFLAMFATDTIRRNRAEGLNQGRFAAIWPFWRNWNA